MVSKTCTSPSQYTGVQSGRRTGRCVCVCVFVCVCDGVGDEIYLLTMTREWVVVSTLCLAVISPLAFRCLHTCVHAPLFSDDVQRMGIGVNSVCRCLSFRLWHSALCTLVYIGALEFTLVLFRGSLYIPQVSQCGS